MKLRRFAAAIALCSLLVSAAAVADCGFFVTWCYPCHEVIDVTDGIMQGGYYQIVPGACSGGFCGGDTWNRQEIYWKDCDDVSYTTVYEVCC